MCESGGKHPLGLKAIVYLSTALGGRGMRSIEEEYKMTKIKSAIKLYSNEDSTMSLVQAFEENAAHQGHQSLVKEAKTFAEELEITLDLSFPRPKCRDNTDGADVPSDNTKRHFKKVALERQKTEVKEKRWQERSSQLDGRAVSSSGLSMTVSPDLNLSGTSTGITLESAFV